ncbi:hypothetical protein [Vulcanisaeta souniana]|uniref:hypothetical protein n=1 Tax=Vulcanisaeta souniana TaxID=164452 RepID=UPI001FB39C2A|nr:hypothetical protein [Vulcanisaeta souniana]
MGKITEILRDSSNDIWERILKHPFVVELFRGGSLPPEKFRFYVIQDYNYLVTLTRCQAMIASKLEEPTVIRRILELALADVSTELENYNKLLNTLGLSLNDVIRARPAPTSTAYMNFLLTRVLWVVLTRAWWLYYHVIGRIWK